MEIATFYLIAAEKCSYILLDSRWALLKGYRNPLGTAQRLLESLWATPKGYRQAAGKCLKPAIGQ
jgi:hypothetical protein